MNKHQSKELKKHYKAILEIIEEIMDNRDLSSKWHRKFTAIIKGIYTQLNWLAQYEYAHGRIADEESIEEKLYDYEDDYKEDK